MSNLKKTKQKTKPLLPKFFNVFPLLSFCAILAPTVILLAVHNGWHRLCSPYIFVELRNKNPRQVVLHAESLTSHQAQNQFSVETVKLFEENMSKTFLFSDWSMELQTPCKQVKKMD